MRRPHLFFPRPRTGPAPFAALGAACAAALLLGGCSDGGGRAAGAAGRGDPPAVLVAGLEDLAAKSGCKLQNRTEAEELQQGACKSGQNRYTLLTFATDEGQAEWLKEAKPWGGTYLVGLRWVVVGTEPTLQTLRQELGGQIQKGEDHGHGSGGHAGHTPG